MTSKTPRTKKPGEPKPKLPYVMGYPPKRVRRRQDAVDDMGSLIGFEVEAPNPDDVLDGLWHI